MPSHRSGKGDGGMIPNPTNLGLNRMSKSFASLCPPGGRPLELGRGSSLLRSERVLWFSGSGVWFNIP